MNATCNERALEQANFELIDSLRDGSFNKLIGLEPSRENDTKHVKKLVGSYLQRRVREIVGAADNEC